MISFQGIGEDGEEWVSKLTIPDPKQGEGRDWVFLEVWKERGVLVFCDREEAILGIVEATSAEMERAATWARGMAWDDFKRVRVVSQDVDRPFGFGSAMLN